MYEATSDRQPVSATYYRPTHDHRSCYFLIRPLGAGVKSLSVFRGLGLRFTQIGLRFYEHDLTEVGVFLFSRIHDLFKMGINSFLRKISRLFDILSDKSTVHP